MDCPGCHAAMTALTLEGRLGASVAIDLCAACQVIWFDHGESLQLSPGATLQLFRRIGEQAGARRGILTSALDCPRCGSPLQPTHDKQRNTAFQYRRCDAKHGRLITFFDFLREKDFIRPLSPAQIAELRRNVQIVNCSNCGAPIDLTRHSACGHCGSPLSLLDLKQTSDLVARLQQADQPARSVDPALPLAMIRARREVETAFASFEREPSWFGEVSSAGMVGAGLLALARWLGKAAGR
ncbi:MAG TPA: zf-TFIIB domain-containing protein [Vicinamibacteria bacterium]